MNSHNSVTCHSSMHAPSLARAFVGGGCEICVFDGGVGICGRMDESLHDGIHSVSACSNSSFKGFSDHHGSPCARWNAFPNSRSELGHELWGETKRSRRGTLCQVRHTAGEKLAFPQQVSGKVHVETWAGGCQSLNLKISREQEVEGRCAVVRFPPRIPVVTPALPGPGSDIRIKMVWYFLTKTEKSGVWFFQNAGDLWWRWVLPLFMGAVDWVWKGSCRTAWAVPCGSSCSCLYAYGRGPAVGPHAGERCWPLLPGDGGGLSHS